jgi:hypothetical protein
VGVQDGVHGEGSEAARVLDADVERGGDRGAGTGGGGG